MKKRNRLTISILAGIFLLACACPVSSLSAINGIQPTLVSPVIPATLPPVSTVAPQQPLNVLYSDDFSVPSKELETYADKSGSVETKDGVYKVTSITDLWNWGSSTSEFSDAVFEFDTSLISGPSNNNAGMGVICRKHTRADKSIDGYLLAISGDGFYSIRSISAGTMSSLVDWTASDSIHQAKATNRIRATCNGSQLTLEVNGNLVATANTIAGGPTSGPFAFAAVSFETKEPLVEVHFDNLVISQP